LRGPRGVFEGLFLFLASSPMFFFSFSLGFLGPNSFGCCLPFPGAWTSYLGVDPLQVWCCSEHPRIPLFPKTVIRRLLPGLRPKPLPSIRIPFFFFFSRFKHGAFGIVFFSRPGFFFRPLSLHLLLPFSLPRSICFDIRLLRPRRGPLPYFCSSGSFLFLFPKQESF